MHKCIFDSSIEYFNIGLDFLVNLNPWIQVSLWLLLTVLLGRYLIKRFGI